MKVEQIILLIINLLGGIAVIGSYIFGLKGQSGGTSVLWGGVPVKIRPIYTVSMLISALSYFAFLFYIFFRLDPSQVRIAGTSGFTMFYIIFIVMLGASALWMPLTNMYVANPGTGLWVGIRLVLAVVGLASIGLFLALLTMQGKVLGVAYGLAIGGSAYFAFHTAILDAVVWAALFK
ncbi:MAG TPA: hypothetical protein VEH58_04595 [Dehalococcoidales bacterium]|nr:hypothetical protein [Dehalococcoidales bacterium]